MELDNAILNLLRTHWGYNSFREGQQEIIKAVCSGKDALGILATGSGKSICYQISGLYLEGVIIVVSPLIALMEDQVQSLRKRHIKAAALHSGISKRQQDALLDNAVYGDLKFIFISPERINSKLFKERIKKMNIALVVVDEAHCISEWGHDFRPAYRNIIQLKDYISDVPILALTATAKPTVASDILSNLELDEPFVFTSTPLRDQLSYNVYKADNKRHFICSLIKKNDEVSIIYCSSRKMVMELWQYLTAHDLSCSYFHGGLDSKEKERQAEAWFKNRTRIMISTKAFGMGIDKSDVRSVYHYQVPDSLEAYVQEAGRAGRDQKYAQATLVFNEDDILKFNRLLAEYYPELDFVKQLYLDLAHYLKVPVGTTKNDQMKFDVNDFLDSYQHPRLPALSAIKFLADSKLLNITEALLHPSELMLNQKETLAALKDKYIADSLKSFVQLLLRNYEGLFHGFTVINEKNLATLFDSKIDKVITALEWISNKGLGTYRRQYEGVYLSFVNHRFDQANIELDEKSYKDQKQRQLDNRESMVDYMRTETCRQVYIAKYFGFEETPCGICDNCRLESHKNENNSFEKEILTLLDKGSIDFHQLVFNFDPALSQIVIQNLKSLISSNDIMMKGMTISKV